MKNCHLRSVNHCWPPKLVSQAPPSEDPLKYFYLSMVYKGNNPIQQTNSLHGQRSGLELWPTVEQDWRSYYNKQKEGSIIVDTVSHQSECLLHIHELYGNLPGSHYSSSDMCGLATAISSLHAAICLHF